MKVKTYYLLLTALLVYGFCPQNVNCIYKEPAAKGIDFFKGSWQEALIEAKRSNKYIFVDVYAKWCGPCKQLKKTFKDPEVGNYFNKNFINVAMNGETDEGRLFLQAYGIASYPTLLIVNDNGRIMARAEGFMKPYILINFGRRVVPLKN